ncbi:MAG: Npun_R2821/Npun_R2822 family protein, partial [Chroococcales cyanobacterium]
IVRREGKAPGSWAGSRHFQREGDRLIDPKVGQPLDYLHWAGFRIEPGCPYWEIWEDYRYLNEPKPERPQQKPAKKSLMNALRDRLRKIKAKF